MKNQKLGRFFSQFRVLSKKSFILSYRNWKGTFAQLIAPLFIILLLLFFQAIGRLINNNVDPDPIEQRIGNINRCIPSSSHYNCKTLIYAPSGVQWVDDVLKRVADKNGLNFDTDFMAMSQGVIDPSGFLIDNMTISNYIKDNQNSTQNVVIFQSAYMNPDSLDKLPADTGYILFYNSTINEKSNYALEWLKEIDNSILKLRTGNENATIDISISSFPKPKDRFASYDIVSSGGGTWLFLPAMIIFFVTMNELVTEKETKLRVGMRMMGLNNFVYWIVWQLFTTVIVVLSSLILIVSGLICQFDYFKNTNFFVLFLMFFVYGVAVFNLAFLLSTLINRVKTSQTLGYSIILIGFVVQSILTGAYEYMILGFYSKSWGIWIRYFLQFYPPYNFAKMYTDIAYLAGSTVSFETGQIIKGEGFKWADLFKSIYINSTRATSPPPYHSLLYLLMNILIFWILTWYLDNAFPSEFGSNKKWYFPFTREYWGLRTDNDKTGIQRALSTLPEQNERVDEDVRKEETRAYEEENVAVRVVNLQKKFENCLPCGSKEVKAVDGTSFVVERGEVFCLLGHNGAGKTTTINMLTGLFEPSGGGASINGFDILTEMDSVRKSLGVCPQHDILWNEMTPYEHLHLFSTLKGVSKNEVESNIEQLLKKVNLLHVKNNHVGTFSGGMKRRLSVAISAIGDPEVIYFDEPSTGLDPVSRGHLWKLIEELKEDKAILLTTHSMEEADTLASRIGIMANGKMKCIGNSLHLKNKFGTGYTVNVSTEFHRSEQIIKQIKNISPSVVLTVNDAGSLSFRVSKENVNEMPNLIEYLEENSHKEVQSKRFSLSEKNTKESLIKEWGVSHTSLEEVFIQVTKNHGFHYGKEEEEDEEIIHEEKEDKDEINIEFEEDSPLFSNKKPIKSFSYKALFRKNVRLQMKQKGSNCCQILTPIMVLLILLVFQLLIKNELGDNANIKQFVPTFPWPLSQYENFDFGNEQSSLDKIENLRAQELGQCWKFFLFSTDKGSVDDAGQLYENGTSSGLLGRIAQQDCQKYLNETFFEDVFVPAFQQTENQTQSNEIIYKAIEVYNENPVQNVTKPPMSNLLPDGSIRFVNIDLDRAYLNYSISVNDNIFNFYHRANNFTLTFFDRIIVQKGKLAFMSMINNAFQSIASARDGEPILVHKPLSNSRFVQELPYFATANLLEIISVLGIILYPIALTIQLPVYIFVLVLEKSEKLKELMKMHGLSDISYTLINYFFFYILYTFTIILFWIFGAIMGLRFFTQTNFFTLAIFFFGWGHSLVSFAFFLSSFINTKRAAVVVGYVFGLIGSLIGVIICVTIYTDEKKLPFYLNLIPQFPFIRGIYLMNTKCINQLACYGSLGGIKIDDEFAQDLIWLFADAIIFFVLHLYLDQVLPREWGVPKHPLFFLGSKVQNFCSRKKSILHEQEINFELNTSDKMDKDVLNELHKVDNGKLSYNDYPMVISHLRKVYDVKPPKIAVKDLCLAIPKGECFGLLGENGAGKSTTISMLTGLILPTTGNAYIGGHSITTQITDVHKRIGVCPQFSILWDDLTVKQHLEFFARLKGIDSKQESVHVERAMKEFGLLKFSDRLSKDLSGGMKRRLSVAISLVGNSQIIFLDEPSTGLDPVSRRQLWKVIERSKKGRVIILTTHAMEEAELLCDRIGIIAHGEMECLGSSLHLKKRFSDGFRIVLNFKDKKEDLVVSTFQKLFPNSKITARYKDSIEFSLSINEGEVSKVFQILVTEIDKLDIDWSFGMISLETVFASVVEHSKEKQKKIVVEESEEN